MSNREFVIKINIIIFTKKRRIKVRTEIKEGEEAKTKKVDEDKEDNDDDDDKNHDKSYMILIMTF